MRAVGSPDLSFFYTPQSCMLWRRHTVKPTARYIIARFTFDIVWPIVYTVFLAITLSWLSGRVLLPIHAGGVNLLPVGGALFDYLENITSLVMSRYPLRTPGVDLLASLATPVKWVLMCVSFVVLVALLIKVLINTCGKKVGAQQLKGFRRKIPLHPMVPGYHPTHRQIPLHAATADAVQTRRFRTGCAHRCRMKI